MTLIEEIEQCLAYLKLGPNNTAHYQRLFGICRKADASLEKRIEVGRVGWFLSNRAVKGLLGDRFKVFIINTSRTRVSCEIYDIKDETSYSMSSKKGKVYFHERKPKKDMDFVLKEIFQLD